MPVDACRTSDQNVSDEQVRVVIAGHVDHGKSTLVGRLFHDTGSLPEGRLAQLHRIAERRGRQFEWANLMDALQVERDQNITIDTAQIWFRTPRRQYVIVDAPGHREFLKQMVTGAAGADAALLVIDAHEGIQEESRRHGYLLSLLGIRQVAVLANKMDLCGYAKARFDELERTYRAFLAAIGLAPLAFIPVSAREGDNIAHPSVQMPWWTGPCVVDALDQFAAARSPRDLPLRFPIQDVYRFDHRRILVGRVESGTLRVGDRLVFCPGGKVSSVRSIERWQAPESGSAEPGDSIGITLAEQIFVERGSVAACETDPPYQLMRFKARLFWMGRQPLGPDRPYRLKLTTQEVDGRLDTIHRVIDPVTLEEIERPGADASIARHEVAEVSVAVARPVAFDPHTDIAETGRFVLMDGYEVSGGGIVLDDNYPRRTADTLHKGENLYWSRGKVTAAQRALRNGHDGCVVWLTGLSGAGKSSIAVELERELFNLGRHTYVLDGDNVRHGLCADLGFSLEDRTENIRRVGEMARLFADAGIIAVSAFISPRRADRDRVRRLVPAGRFIEVYVNAPLDVCERRDSKGLYARARAGEIPQFTGISAPYEPPLHPEIELRTDALSVQESVAIVVGFLADAARTASFR